MLTRPCTHRGLLRGFTNTHILTYAQTCIFVHQNNCVPPLAVKPCQCLVSSCIDSFLASPIRKGQGGVVCTVTQCADCTHPVCSDLSVRASLRNFVFFFICLFFPAQKTQRTVIFQLRHVRHHYNARKYNF